MHIKSVHHTFQSVTDLNAVAWCVKLVLLFGICSCIIRCSKPIVLSQLFYGLMTASNCFNGFIFNILIYWTTFQGFFRTCCFYSAADWLQLAVNLCYSSGNVGKYLSSSEFLLSWIYALSLKQCPLFFLLIMFTFIMNMKWMNEWTNDPFGNVSAGTRRRNVWLVSMI